MQTRKLDTSNIILGYYETIDGSFAHVWNISSPWKHLIVDVVAKGGVWRRERWFSLDGVPHNPDEIGWTLKRYLSLDKKTAKAIMAGEISEDFNF